MTQETLNKAIEINKKIDKYKAFLKAYNSTYSNEIVGNNYKAQLERVREIIILDNEPELEMMIREYIMHKIEALEQEFAKLN